MLEYERVDISEGIDVNKTNLSKELNMNLIFVMAVMI